MNQMKNLKQADATQENKFHESRPVQVKSVFRNQLKTITGVNHD